MEERNKQQSGEDNSCQLRQKVPLRNTISAFLSVESETKLEWARKRINISTVGTIARHKWGKNKTKKQTKPKDYILMKLV